MSKAKVIELWKDDCGDCEAAKPIVKELVSKGYEFDIHNIAGKDGNKLWTDFEKEIDSYSKEQGWEEGYIYTNFYKI